MADGIIRAAMATLVAIVCAMDGALGSPSYYVAPDGDDRNPGTLAAPWRRIQFAAERVAPGSTVFIRDGLYRERVTIRVSGNPIDGYIRFRGYPGERPIIDAAGLGTPSAPNGLFLIANRSYIAIEGLELRNARTALRDRVPTGIHVRGGSHHIQLNDNLIHAIAHDGTMRIGADAHAIAVYGSDPVAPIHDLQIKGNDVFDLRLGSSEAIAINGNVAGFEVTDNRVHDCNNIGIDAIGFERVSPDPSTDQARDGVISGNLVYNIDSFGNPAYGRDRSAAGIYVDGGRDIVIERNQVHDANIGIELASEHPGRTTDGITVRSNMIYRNDIVGIYLGGYDRRRGGTSRCALVGNTLFENDRLRWGIGEIGLQYQVTETRIVNNLVSANPQGVFITGRFPGDGSNFVDHNVYFARSGAANGLWQWNGTRYRGFDRYRDDTGNDTHSSFVEPRFVDPGLPDLHLRPDSPAIGSGDNRQASGRFDIDHQARVRNIVDSGADETRW
ncbi:MAG: right-handed parallel beta-helix repeat-containing protein [Methylotetracoccus sp.]